MPESGPQKKQPENGVTEREDGETDERSYYYDDAHGYEDFDPEADVEEEDEVGDRSGLGSVYRDLNVLPAALPEFVKAQGEADDVPGEDGQPNMYRLKSPCLLDREADA